MWLRFLKTLWLIPLVTVITITRSSSFAENEIAPPESSSSLAAEDAEISEDNVSSANVTKRQTPCALPQHQIEVILDTVLRLQSELQQQKALPVSQQIQPPESGPTQSPGKPALKEVNIFTAIPVPQPGSQPQPPLPGFEQIQFPESEPTQPPKKPGLKEVNLFTAIPVPQPQQPVSPQLSEVPQLPGAPIPALTVPPFNQPQQPVPQQYPVFGSTQTPGLPQSPTLSEILQAIAGPQPSQIPGVPQLSQIPGVPQPSQGSGVPLVSRISDLPTISPGTPQIRPDVVDQFQNIQGQDFNDEWERFKEIYNKSYASFEIETIRKQYYIQSSIFISNFNKEFSIGKKDYILKINAYADESDEEFFRLHHGFLGGNRLVGNSVTGPSAFVYPVNTCIPKRIDWRNLNAVTRVRDQQRCACCHAISAVGAIEGQYFRKTGQLAEFSVQNVIDCPSTKNYQSNGCKKGSVDENFKYVKDNPGIDFEHIYQYEGHDLSCRFKPEGVATTVTGYVPIPEGDEKALEAAVATVGPISVGIDGNSTEFRHYGGQNIFNGPCSNVKSDINHAVLLVGYDEEPNGDKYWILKNSQGTSWGNDGYMKLAKDKNNTCAIASSAMYPLL